MTLFNKKLGAVLKNIRNERNLSQQEIADRLGVSHGVGTIVSKMPYLWAFSLLLKSCDLINDLILTQIYSKDLTLL